jgi:hypothetical protein
MAFMKSSRQRIYDSLGVQYGHLVWKKGGLSMLPRLADLHDRWLRGCYEKRQGPMEFFFLCAKERPLFFCWILIGFGFGAQTR